MHGPIHRHLMADHQRLDALLERAAADPAHLDLAAFHLFRVGILRHIGIEEKILLPEAKRRRGGDPLPVAERLREDHSAIATMLVPTPTREIVEGLRRIFAAHNPLEEDEGGMYDAVERLLPPADADAVLERVKTAPDPPVVPYCDTPRIEARIARLLERLHAGD